MAYALVDPTTGYCQGMADLAAPFVHLYTTDHEVRGVVCLYWAAAVDLITALLAVLA